MAQVDMVPFRPEGGSHDDRMEALERYMAAFSERILYALSHMDRDNMTPETVTALIDTIREEIENGSDIS